MKWTLTLLCALAVIACGAYWIGQPEVADDAAREAIARLRLIRVIAGVVAGAALASCGLLMQTTLHNPLASPFTLGANAGAALAVMGAMMLLGSGAGTLAMASAAFAGALVVSLPLIVLAARRAIPPEAVLLAGVAISFGAGALTSVMTLYADVGALTGFVRWTFGSLAVVKSSHLAWLIALCLPVIAFCWAMRHQLDALLSGDELAQARGVRVERLRSISVLCSTLAVAGVVAVCGPIAFVGLVIPHMARALSGASHRWLSLSTPLAGALLIVLCDWAGARLLENSEIPIGVTVAVVGAPAFVLLLVLRFKRTGRA